MHIKLNKNQLQKGQLLFRYTNSSEISNVSGISQLKVDHIAMVLNKNFVIEATPTHGVTKTSLDDFLIEGNVLAADVSMIDKSISIKAVDLAVKFIGAPYNHTFLNSTNKGFYCSQLITESYKLANNGNSFFKEDTLNFKDSNGMISSFWIKYFNAHNMKVPQGEVGSHPTRLFFDSRLKNRYNLIKSTELEYQRGMF